jgi:bifunctional non-homologous end joining protein LigD
MGLVEYKKKRRLNQTPEPAGGKASGSKLQFVIQKHQASHLHYDFRLELRGVLVSWAIPKGPSLNPSEKRLAMQVEDHPFDYKDFEGIIPEGNYGAGTVIIWDKGTYEPLEPAKSKAGREKQVSAGLHKGSLKIRLHGEKLRGDFALVKTKGRGKNSWLLIKHRDEFATDESISEAEASVVSGRTLDEVASDRGSKKWSSNRQTKMKTPTKSSSKSRTKPKASGSEADARALLKSVLKKKKAPMPEEVKPMLATLVDEAFDESGWLYEIKWDGYRAISYIDNGDVRIRSRNNKDFNIKFYPIRQTLEGWKTRAVVDGEIVVLNEKGEPDFEALQEWRSEADGELIYYLFDVIWLEG